MAIRTMTDCGPPLTEKDISIAEKKLGGKFPSAYREFLLEFNGGHPEPCNFSRNVIVAFFYGLLGRDTSYDLFKQNKLSRRRLPQGVLAIADDPFGNEICLALEGKNRGKVYFWDHEGASPRVDPRIEFPWLDLGDDFEFKGDDWPGHPDLTFVTDGFEEFLQGLRDFSEDEATSDRQPTGKKPPAKKPASRKKTPSRKRTSGAARPRKKH